MPWGLRQAFISFLWARTQGRVARRFQQWQSLHGNNAHLAAAVAPSLEGRRNREKWGRHHFLGVLGDTHTVCFLGGVFVPLSRCPVPAVTFLERSRRVCPRSMDPKLPILECREGSGFLFIPGEGDHIMGCCRALGAVGRELTRPLWGDRCAWQGREPKACRKQRRVWLHGLVAEEPPAGGSGNGKLGTPGASLPCRCSKLITTIFPVALELPPDS